MSMVQILKTLFCLTFLSSFGNSLSLSPPTLPHTIPALKDSNLSQCSLVKIDRLTQERSHLCSTTQVSSSRSITAAHCFMYQPLDIGIKTSLSNDYELICPHQNQPIKVKNIAIHPQFIAFDKTDFRDFFLLKTYDQNDIAILSTEPLALPVYPIYTATKTEVRFKPKSCHTLGYSPIACGQDNYGCLRDDFSLTPRITENSGGLYLNTFCHLPTGNGCIGVERRADYPLSHGVLLAHDESVWLQEGDSGAGLLCETNQNREILGGVYIRGNGSVVNVQAHFSFIDSYVKMTDDEFAHQSALPAPHSFISMMTEAYKLETKIYQKIHKNIYVNVYSTLLTLQIKKLLEWLQEDAHLSAFTNSLIKNNVTRISFWRKHHTKSTDSLDTGSHLKLIKYPDSNESEVKIDLSADLNSIELRE